jgi:outer membrane protein TolC
MKPSPHTLRWLRRSCVACVALASGCASTDPHTAFAPVQQTVRNTVKQELPWPKSPQEQAQVDARVNALLAQPLSSEQAVEVALLNNAKLKASLQQLGIAQADIAQATRLPNPGFTFGRFRSGDEREIERSWHLGLARLIAMPWLKGAAEDAMRQTQADVTMQALALTAQTRRAWIAAVHAQEVQRYALQVMEATEASAELARRMQQVGNFNKLQQAREQAFYADAVLAVARAQAAVQSTRERLIQAMGLWGEQLNFKLPDRLPDLPKAATERPDVEAAAMATRLDVQSAKAYSAQTARSLGLWRVQRFVNVMSLGYELNTSNEGDRSKGYEVSLELPLFDWGDARMAKAQAIYMQSVHRTADVAVHARSEVREAYGHYRLTHDIAKHHREEVVPLKQRIADESLLRYNGMIIGVFELLADARAQVASVVAAIDALRDFWMAQADLDMAMVGKPMLSLPAAAAQSSAAGPGADPH